MATAAVQNAAASDDLAPKMEAMNRSIKLNDAARLGMRVLRGLLLAELVLFFAARGLAYFKDVHNYKFFDQLLAAQAQIEAPARGMMKAYIPTNFNGKDISGWLFVFILYILEGAAARQAVKFKKKGDVLRQRRLAAEQAGTGLWSLQSSLAALARGENLDRKKVLEIYTEAKKALEGQRRELAFLSIDVVDSTGMKVGETKEAVERDMIEYRKLVEEALAMHGMLKAAWTPDGVMICLPSSEHAVKAGQRILRNLKEFNAKTKTIKRDFAVRMGINSGMVSYDETIPMEEMADRVIDIAGHMQKYGTVNMVCATRQAAEGLLGKLPLKHTSRVVDNCEVYECGES